MAYDAHFYHDSLTSDYYDDLCKEQCIWRFFNRMPLKLVGKIGGWLIIAAYIIMFLSNSALLLRQYAEYTLITALPQVNFQFMIIWYAVTIGIVCYLGIEALCRTGYIMLPLFGGRVSFGYCLR